MGLTVILRIYTLRMQRKKGQFTSSKAISDEAGSASDWNGGSGQDEETM